MTKPVLGVQQFKGSTENIFPRNRKWKSYMVATKRKVVISSTENQKIIVNK